jgi:hypothetical protein
MKHDAMQRMRGYAHPPRTPVDFRAILGRFTFLEPRFKVKFQVNSQSAHTFLSKRLRLNKRRRPPRASAAVFTHTSSRRPSQVSPTRMTHLQSLRRLARPLRFHAAVPPRPPISAPLPKDSVDGAAFLVFLNGSPRHQGGPMRLPDRPPGRSLAVNIRGYMFVHLGGARVHFHGGVPRPPRDLPDRDFVTGRIVRN